MTMINNEDVIGYRLERNLVCETCISASEMEDIEAGDVVTREWADKQDLLIFCDRCNVKMW